MHLVAFFINTPITMRFKRNRKTKKIMGRTPAITSKSVVTAAAGRIMHDNFIYTDE